MKKLRYAASCIKHRATSAGIGANHRLAKIGAAAVVGLGGLMVSSAQTTPTGIDAAISDIVDGLKESLSTTVGKALGIGVVVLTGVVAWRVVKKFTS